MGLVYISSPSSGTHIKRLLTKIVKKTMAHLLRQMYVDEIDFVLVFRGMIHDKMQQLEKEELAKQGQTDGNQWSRFKKCSEVLNHEGRWVTYAEQALSLLNHEVMWQGIVEACKILKYPEPSAMHRDYFETLFDTSCFIWFQIYSESKRIECISSLIDYIICVCIICVKNLLYTCHYILCVSKQVKFTISNGHHNTYITC